MSSVVPFQELGLQLSSSAVAAVAKAAAAAVVPKIEPKTEPIDDFPLTHIPKTQSLPNPSPNSGPNPGPGQNPDRSLKRSLHCSKETDVSSEFNRISEMFRSSLLQNHQDSAASTEESDSKALIVVPASNEGQQVSNFTVSSREIKQRSSELVRVTDLRAEDQRYHRDDVRRARMLYESLRVRILMEDEKKDDIGNWRSRADLKAAQLMRMRGLWLYRDKRIVGHIPGLFIGDVFLYRMELCVVGLHGQAQAGIDYLPAAHSSNGEPIATSVIVSGGYEDDEDSGDVIIYTGHGGQNKFARQCGNQKLESGNLAMERSMAYGIEVRVIRGFKYEGSVSGKVYVYDGLYRIVECWCDVGKSGFGVFKYKLVRIENQPDMGSLSLKFAQNIRKQPLLARPKGYISLDLSRNKENVHVSLYNDIDADQEPAYYEYLSRTIFPPHVHQNAGNGTGCLCVSGCSANCLCAMRNGGEFAYDSNGILIRGKPLVIECGPHCRCPPTCRNRVTQRGIRNKFEVFRSRETGWGVRSLDLIQAGSFICEYSGVVLTREQAQIFKMNGDSLVYPSRFAQKWVQWGDVSQVYTNYVRPTYPPVPPVDFAMDVSKMRNLACYISHSTSPNVFLQLVLYDHNNFYFPRIMLFALENIPPLRELSIDYGVADVSTAKLAICN